MITKMGSDEFRQALRERLDAAMRGQTTVVERYGEPLAVMIPHEEWERMRRAVALLEVDRQVAEVRAGDYVTQEELDAMVAADADSL
jgi:prevent-host-death family protein